MFRITGSTLAILFEPGESPEERLKSIIEPETITITSGSDDEQMERLKGTINSLPHQEVLYSLYQDLKKLKG